MVGSLGRKVAAALAALVMAAAATAAGAGAATPIYLGPGALYKGPAIDSTASGGVVSSFTVDETLHYCRIDLGASSCAASGYVVPPSGYTEDLGNWPFAEGSEFGLLDTRRNGGIDKKLFYVLKADGTPTAAKEVATNAGGGSLGFTEAASAPIGAITPGYFLGTVAGGPSTYGAILAAAEATTLSGGSEFSVSRNAANTEAIGTADAAIAVQGSMLSTAYVGLFGGDSGKVFWRRLLGAGNPAYVQSNSHWSTPRVVGEARVGSPIRMASGPHGLFLAYSRPSDGTVVMQQYDGFEGFEGAVAITPPEVADFAIAEDPEGLVHVAYTLEGPETTLHYRYAKDGLNQSFTNPQVLAEADYRDLRLVANAGGGGWVSWLDDASSSNWIQQMEPGEPPLPTVPGGSSGGSGSPAGPGGGGSKQQPPKAGGGTATKSASLGHGLVGQLAVPKACVAPGANFKAKLRVKRKGSRAHKVAYTVKRVKFLVAGTTTLVDTKKPFEASFSTGSKAGKTLPVTARVTVNLHLGHRVGKVTKSLTAKVRTCG